MPVPNFALDLDSWAESLPKERSNDHEYNLLLYRFKTFLNEVKDYHKLHANCSITLASAHQDKLLADSIANTQSSSLSSSVNNNDSTNTSASSANISANGDQSTGLPTNGQYVINLKKKLFQNQELAASSRINPRDNLVRQQTVHQFYHAPARSANLNQHDSGKIGATTQHYNSSHNLAPSNTSGNNGMVINQNQAAPTMTTSSRPEIRERVQLSASSRYKLSKSSERLFSINNNNIHLPIASSLDEKDLNNVQARRFNAPFARDSRYLQNDDNIYDAVSPDDTHENENLAHQNHQQNNQQSVSTIPINDPSCRSSLSQKNKLESKSTFIVSSSEINRNHDRPVISTSSLKNPNQDRDEQDRASNSFNSSSIVLENSNNTSSSLSLNPSFNQQEYSNYVNIDFFLKRSHSPSFDGLEEEENSSDQLTDDETTQISHSFSSDKLCDEALKSLSPKELARRLSQRDNTATTLSSSASITPASSGDLFDDIRSPSSNLHHLSSSASSTGKHHDPNNSHTSGKYSSFLSPPINREHTSSSTTTILTTATAENQARSNSSSVREHNLSASKFSPQYAKTLEMIQENQLSLLKQSPFSKDSDSDGQALAEAHGSMRSFLSDLNLTPVDDVFEDKAQRRIVKESFAVELCKTRKLRHLFLFNDVIVCAKYQASSKQKFTFDVKWYLNLNGVTVSDTTQPGGSGKANREALENEILAIRTNLMIIRSRMQQLKRGKDKRPSKVIKKLTKKKTELEADLVLLIPHLPLVIKHTNGKKYSFYVSSNFDRNQWIESIKFLQSQLPATKSSSLSPSSSELQAWIQTCRKNLNPSLGTFLLRSNCDDDLLYGDLYITARAIKGVPKSGHFYFCFEVDSYGHFSQKASSVVLKLASQDNDLNDEYIFPLDGAHTLRILLYEDLGQQKRPSVVGKAHVELSTSWFLDKPVQKTIDFDSNCSLVTQLSFSNSELLSMRIPHAKLCPSFGLDITQVCKKEKTNIPLLIQLCVNEVERRGLREVGIYRMSGTSTDIQRLKKAFETNPYVAELLLRDIDINSVTGFLKQYLREMPEGLFINKLYPKFVAAFNIPQTEPLERAQKMLELFHRIPIANQRTILYLVEHLVKLNQYESYNKMSLTNLATVLGPNILRPPSDSSNATSSDPFTAVVIGSMSQAGILYFFLNRRASNLPLLELDTSELAATNP